MNSQADYTMRACCAYLRKSREDEERERMGKGETLARHRKIIERLASDNGDTVAEWFAEVVSGETIAGRPEMTRLLRELAANRWDAVYVVEASRLGRGGGSDQEKIVNAFRYTDTLLITEEKTYQPGSAADMRALKAALRSSEDELESISARLMRGRYESAREGCFQATGRTPYGWRAVRIDGKWQLEPDENHANMLRIYDLLESGESYAGIARIFQSEGIPTPRGGKAWRSSTVRTIATNAVNAGIVAYARNRRVKVFDKDTFEVRTEKMRNDDAVIVRGLHAGDACISVERFEKVIKKTATSAHVREGRELKNPLAGMLRCERCGHALVMHTKRSGKSMASFYEHPHGCDETCVSFRSARADDVIEAVIAALEQTCEDMAVSADDGGRAEFERHKAALLESLHAAEEAKERIMQAFEAGVYSMDDMRERSALANERIAGIERELSALKPPADVGKRVTTLRECIGMLRDEGISAKAKNDFLRSVVERIDYENDTPQRAKPNRFRLHIELRD